MKPLGDSIAVVARATCGAGRGIACILGEAGATVYRTARSVRGAPSPIARPETIEETAELVSARGGTGVWARLDHRSCLLTTISPPGQADPEACVETREAKVRVNVLA